ncbi:MAG TPA: efflux RND transporter periplasmic adaptor subunit [Flavobacterium sp.]|nr:efflux RND transporter periplasmic adaptor subunit [Flavobacterium sp.]
MNRLTRKPAAAATIRTGAIAIFTIGAVFALQACKKEKTAEIPEKSEQIAVKAIPLQQEGVSGTVAVSGQFSTDDEVVLSFKSGGIVAQLPVKEGDYVKKGQVLARLDLTEIRASLNQSQLAVMKAKRDFQRMSSLYKDSVVTLEQFQNAKTALDVAKQQSSAVAFNMAYSEIRALANGYILKKFANAGQLVAPGQPILQANGAGKSKWVLKAGLSDADWPLVNSGDKATVKTDALPGEALEGRVARKSQGVDPETGTFSIEIEIDASHGKKLASGMFGSAEIQTRKGSGLWTIPYEALLDANGSTGFVFITDDNKTARKVPVEISQIGKNEVQIKKGLENHKSLITSGNAYLGDKSKITIIK